MSLLESIAARTKAYNNNGIRHADCIFGAQVSTATSTPCWQSAVILHQSWSSFDISRQSGIGMLKAKFGRDRPEIHSRPLAR